MRRLVLVLACALVAGCGGEAEEPRAKTATDAAASPASPSATASAIGPSDPGGLERDRFHAGRAFALLERQVKVYGERPAGSDALRRLAEELRGKLPNGRFENVPGHPGLRNVVGHLRGARGKAIVVAAHYDTKVIPGFVGAEDGAGGTAAVVELARGLRAWKRPAGSPEVRFVLFDGEECDDDSKDFYSCGLRGSKAYAARHAKEIRSLILLDFVAQKDLAIRYEPGSDRRLWTALRGAAKAVGALDAFPPDTQGTILDDHTPFRRQGIPAIDLIDFEFPCWHKTCDDLSVVSAESLDKSGEAVHELLRRLIRAASR